MEAKGSGGFNPQGSFGIPKQMQENMEAQRAKQLNNKSVQPGAPSNEHLNAAGPTSPLAQKTTQELSNFEQQQVEEAKQKKLDDEADQRRIETMIRMKDEIEEQYAVSVTAEDVQTYLFQGRLSKEMEVFPDFTITLQSPNPSELMEVDEHMAKFMDKGKFTPEGLANEKTIKLQSYVWIKAKGKQLGKDRQGREDAIRKMAPLLVEGVAQAYNDFTFLLKFALQEKSILKKRQAPLK